MINYRYKPFYLEFPILQISYFVFWIPLGYIAANIISWITVSIVFSIFAAIAGAILPLSFELFVISGRMQAMIQPYYFLTAIAFDFMILIIGLELISYFINKKRKDGGFDV